MEFEITPAGVVLALLGAGLGYFVSNSMDPPFFWKLIATVACGGVGLVISSFAANN